jgi:hypothetical protein
MLEITRIIKLSIHKVHRTTMPINSRHILLINTNSRITNMVNRLKMHTKMLNTNNQPSRINLILKITKILLNTTSNKISINNPVINNNNLTVKLHTVIANRHNIFLQTVINLMGKLKDNLMGKLIHKTMDKPTDNQLNKISNIPPRPMHNHPNTSQSLPNIPQINNHHNITNIKIIQTSINNQLHISQISNINKKICISHLMHNQPNILTISKFHILNSPIINLIENQLKILYLYTYNTIYIILLFL